MTEICSKSLSGWYISCSWTKSRYYTPGTYWETLLYNASAFCWISKSVLLWNEPFCQKCLFKRNKECLLQAVYNLRVQQVDWKHWIHLNDVMFAIVWTDFQQPPARPLLLSDFPLGWYRNLPAPGRENENLCSGSEEEALTLYLFTLMIYRLNPSKLFSCIQNLGVTFLVPRSDETQRVGCTCNHDQLWRWQ